MSRILTGIQASGKPHLGNLLGAIEPAITLSSSAINESFLFIADLHSMTTIKNRATLIENTNAVASAWLACGFDSEKNYFYRQSRLAGYHAELMWYLSCLTPYPMLANAHSFKDKSNRLSDVNAGLFTYPILQAADILLYQAEFIPIGKDQKQHLEMAKDMAETFNRTYGEVFVLPEPIINDSVMVVPGIDGNKMSKSSNNYIDVFLPENDLYKQIKRIITDATPLEEPKNPNICIVFKLYSLVANETQIEKMRENYRKGGYGYGHAKKELLEVLLHKYKNEREVFDFYISNLKELESKLKIGEKKAEIIAKKTISDVRQKIGF